MNTHAISPAIAADVPRWPSVPSAVLWVATGAAAVGRNLTDDDQWQSAYAAYSVVLVVAIATTLVSVALATDSAGHRGRAAAVGLCVLAGLSALVAWAQPLWAVLVAIAVAALGFTGTRLRRESMLVAAGPLIGLLVSIVGIVLHLGKRDEWGDYVDAQMVGVVVGCLATSAALVSLGRRVRTAALSSQPAVHDR